MVLFGQSACIWLKRVVFGKIVVFGQNGCIWAKVVVFGQIRCIRKKNGCIRENCGCIRGKVVVFVLSGGIRVRWLYLGRSGCIPEKAVVFAQN